MLGMYLSNPAEGSTDCKMSDDTSTPIERLIASAIETDPSGGGPTGLALRKARKIIGTLISEGYQITEAEIVPERVSD